MVQTLSWLEDWKKPLEITTSLNPRWIAFSTLLYDGKIEYKIQLLDYERQNEDSDCEAAYSNKYSLPIIKEYLLEKGYLLFRSKTIRN